MTKQQSFTVGLVQHKDAGTLQGNIESAVQGISAAAAQGAQIVSLAELFSTKYFCTKEAVEHFDLAESIPGPTTAIMQKLAQQLQVVLVVPLFEKVSPGVYYNSAAVIDADGSLLGVYRKMHIPDDPLFYEKHYFTPGEVSGIGNGFRVFHTRYARLAVLICWDQWFPEAARISALLGAELIVYPTAIGWHPREKEQFGVKEASAWRTIQLSHAIANGLYVAAVNRVGLEETAGTEGIEFFGQSFICDPFGEILAQAPSESPAIITAKCSGNDLELVRRNWPFFRDRRIDAYRPLLKRFLGGVE